MTGPDLHVSLDTPLPKEVHVGRGTAMFVTGTCFCPTERIDSLELLVDSEPQPLGAHGMPRLDFFADLHPSLDPYETAALAEDPQSKEDPLLHSYRSGFWGMAVVPAGSSGPIRLALRARLASGELVVSEFATVARAGPVAAPVPWTPSADGASVAICMATYDPPAELFHRQIESIRAQTHLNWICVISDDCSSEHGFATIQRETAGDKRFVVSRSPRRLGFYNNFERALALAPASAEFVAMADQDDSWFADKLAVLVQSIGAAQLIYSDARVVSRTGEVISDTWWNTRRNNHSDLLSLLVANAVTGAASLLRRELLDHALPFPPSQFAHFHDHWLALTALVLGEIEFVDRPLYDYVQHREASLGHAGANQMTSLRERLFGQRSPQERVRMWRLHYFVDISRLRQMAAILELRCGDRMPAPKRRTLQRFRAADGAVAPLVQLFARGARELLGLGGRPETLGAEWMLFHALGWRRLLNATVRDRPQRRLRLDAVPPPSLALKPSRGGQRGPAEEIADKIAPLDLTISSDQPARVNLLIPTVDLQHFFGGYIAKLNLARRLAERGLRVRLVTVDPVGPLPRNWKREIESYSGLAGLFELVEVEFGRSPSPLAVSPEDRFIATTWWTAHIAARAADSVAADPRFVYLIQEYEPFTFAMGTYAALARQSYDFEHFGIFSTELLRDYFRRHGIGVYAGGAARGDAESVAFQNAITDVVAPTVNELSHRRSRRLLFYARPEPHAARNMFELGMLALSRAIELGYFGPGWELRGIGTVNQRRSLALSGGVSLDLIPRSEQHAYAELLREHDVGIALMYTPHPSLVPIEMAAAGLLTVTNTFENKTPEALAAISTNLIATSPTVDGVAAGLREACAGIEDHERRVSGSAVDWSRDWATSLGPAVLEVLLAELTR